MNKENFLVINPKDIRIDMYSQSGEIRSIVRVTHIPTGIMVECKDETNTFRNRQKALEILKSRLQESHP